MILLHGYYGERNAGDDAFATVCAERLSPTAGPVYIAAAELPRTVVQHATPLLFRRRWKGLAQRIEQRRIRSIMARGGRLILGGGSLLRSTEGIRQIRDVLEASPGAAHAALGISIGPWRDPGAEAACASLLTRFAFVGVRDAVSLERGRSLAPSVRMELTFDLAPLLMPAEESAVRRGGTLGVALCGPVLTPAQFEHLERVLGRWLVGAPDREVVLFPFNVHPRKGDIAVHRDLGARLRSRGKVRIEHYDGDPRTTWRRISQLQGLVAMRLHAGIFGYCTRTPTLLLPYEEKCHAWAEMSQHPPEFVRAIASTEVQELERLVDEAPNAALPLEAARTAAVRNFEAIGA